jgi:hypothetical protein
LSNSYTFLFPGVGHGVFDSTTNACGDRIRLAFVNNPTQKPDGSCISGLGEPLFQ